MTVSSDVAPQKPETGFLDRLGGRFLVRGRAGEIVEILIFRDDLVSAPGFEAAIRQTVARQAAFRHPAVRRVRGVARLAEPDNRLALVSDSSAGVRLSELLLAADRDGRPVPMRAALYVVREMLAAVQAIHEAPGGLFHGALGPERIVVTPEGRVVVVEHVLGRALECHAATTQERFWRDYRVAARDESDEERFGPRTDVLQCGLVALALVLGRLLRRDEYPRKIGELLLGATESRGAGSRIPLGLGLRAWLVRALQFGTQDSYETIAEAQAGITQMLAGFNGYAADPAAVRAMFAEPSGPHQVAAAADSTTDSGARAAAPIAAVHTPPLLEHQPAAPPVAAGVRPGTVRETTSGAVVSPALRGPAPVAPAAAAASVSGPAVEPVSVESLSTPPGIECIAAEVRTPPVLTPGTGARLLTLRSGAHVAAPRSDGHSVAPASAAHALAPRPAAPPKEDSPRMPAGEAGTVETPRVHGPTLFGATEAPERVARPGGGRRWKVIGAAAAGLILLAAGVPGFWLLSRQSPPPPKNTAAAESQAAASGTGGQPAASDRSQAGSEGTAARPTGAAPVPGTPAGATPPAAQTSQAAPAGAPTTLAIPMGEITVAAPLPMQILENGTPIGSSPGPAISLPAGRHDIEIANDSIGFRETRTIDVRARRTLPIVVNLPMGTMSVNAQPWAEVWLDDQKVGETPLANLEVSVGPHEIVFRHPQLGERRQTVVVTLMGPLRVSVDLRKQP